MTDNFYKNRPENLRWLNNIEILRLLTQYINDNPDMRFIQALWGLGIINRDETGTIEDKFYEESKVTLEKLNSIKQKGI